jgi:hypothetical protein
MIAPKRCSHGLTAARAPYLALVFSPAFTHGQQHRAGDDLQASTSYTRTHAIATQVDAWFENYYFHDGEILPCLRMYYATLGSPYRDAQGKIDNVVLGKQHGRKSYGCGHCTRRTGLSLSTLCRDKALGSRHWLAETDTPFR